CSGRMFESFHTPVGFLQVISYDTAADGWMEVLNSNRGWFTKSSFLVPRRYVATSSTNGGDLADLSHVVWRSTQIDLAQIIKSSVIQLGGWATESRTFAAIDKRYRYTPTSPSGRDISEPGFGEFAPIGTTIQSILTIELIFVAINVII
ncbi:MAG: hypothetical protein ACRDDF_11555, partial [Aeromonas sp.]